MVLDHGRAGRQQATSTAHLRGGNVFALPSLNAFAGPRRLAWDEARGRANVAGSRPERAGPLARVARSPGLSIASKLLLPAAIGDYADFSPHANTPPTWAACSAAPDQALLPNWLPPPGGLSVSGRHGGPEAGAEIIRPREGRCRRPAHQRPSLGPRPNWTLNWGGFFAGPGNRPGEPLTGSAANHIFGWPRARQTTGARATSSASGIPAAGTVPQQEFLPRRSHPGSCRWRR